MKKLLFTAGVMVIMAMAMALATYNKVFHDKYNVKKDSTLGKADCAVCHVKPKGGKLNAYGKDLSDAMKAEKSKKLTPAILAKVEGLDSDKDGKKNIDEIKADSNPGQ
ncbi:MAG: hypothetical protein HONBIEJF_02626 [Fimbriimonadaceae bacterium]|nr:hypothetical protein [Fimbriimonadaceae bacterium]